MIELRTVGFQVEEELLGECFAFNPSCFLSSPFPFNRTHNDEQIKTGTGVLSLEKSFSAPEEFRVQLINDEQPVGWIYGCIHTRIVPPPQQR